jgi:subtilisin family serine protease
VTGVLAAALLLPHATSTVVSPQGPARAITLLTGQAVRLAASGTPRPASNLVEGRLFGTDLYALPRSMDPAIVGASPHATAKVIPYDELPMRDLIGEIKHLDMAHGGPELVNPALMPGRSVVLPGGFFDPRLFDVTYQTANGYDDASSDRIPVIVQFDSQRAVRQAMARGLVDGVHFTHAFEYVPDALGYVDKHGPFVSPIPDLPDGLVAIYLDAREQIAPSAALPSDAGRPSAQQPIGPSLAEALPLIGADVARKRGLTGQGIKIAIVDTGIDGTHADLAGRIIAARDFSTDGNTNDNIGHGTHVAGIAAGTGKASDGKYGGVAPAAELINAKALNRNGSGTMDGVMQAMEWAADQGARIENLSLGSGPADGTDPASQLVNALTRARNVLFVIAAGNSGPQGKVSSPAAADDAFAVGAIDKQRVLAPFSSRGPRLGDMAVKPDIVAPGVRITAPRANPGGDDPYATYSGTSMAAPMVAGAAALVMQLHPDWPALTVKDALMNSADPLGDENNYVGVYDQGAGVVNLANLIDLKLLIQPANVSFGVIDDEHPGIKVVRLQNLTDHPYTVDLSWHMRVVEGSGSATMSTPTPHITLPPAGTFKVTFIVTGSGNFTVSSEILAMRDGQVIARAAAGFTIRGG